MTTNNHKTGKFYTVHIYIRPDQREFLKKQKEKYIEEFKQEPKFIFSSSKNKVESSICRGLREVFAELFGDNESLVRFNANSIRKFWEKMWTVIKGKVSEGVHRAHLAQTAHSEKTAQEKYLAKNGTREERLKVLDIYLERLNSSGEDEDEIEEETANAPPDEEVCSEFEEDEPIDDQPSSMPPTPLVPVRRFDMVRNSLTTSTPQPVNSPVSQPAGEPQIRPAKNIVKQKIVQRESLNSTLEEDSTLEEKRCVDTYLRSMRNFRVKPGKPEWTEEQKKACRLFESCRYTVNRMDVRKRVAEGGYQLTDAQCDRIYDKVKAAVQVFKKAK